MTPPEPTTPEPAPAPEPTGLAALRHLLVDDEAGSAAVEFVVLIPVYLLMTCALLSITQLMLMRQQVVAAVRYEAWCDRRGGTANTAANVQQAFFGNMPGTWTSTEQPERPVTTTLPALSGGGPQQIARMVLDNEVPTDDKPLRRVEVDGQFQWSGLEPIIGMKRGITVGAKSVVILQNQHQRPVFQDGQGTEHAMLEQALGRSVGATPAFDPVGANNPILNPVFGHFMREAQKDPGLWNHDARIDGSDAAERSFYGGPGRRRQ